MKLIIAGGRDYQPDLRRAEVVETLLDEVTELVTGCAPGADQYGIERARIRHIPIQPFPADWGTHGKAAGPIRNRRMAEYAEAVVLLPGGRGTESMAQEARRAGLWVFDLRAGGGS